MEEELHLCNKVRETPPPPPPPPHTHTNACSCHQCVFLLQETIAWGMYGDNIISLVHNSLKYKVHACQ